MSKNKDVQKAVLEYLNQQNRPYSAIDVFNNLHKEYGKTAVTKSLDELAESGKIKKKTYGKQCVYVANQDNFSSLSDAEMKTLETDVQKLTSKLQNLQNEVSLLEKEQKQLSCSLSTEEAQKQLETYTKDNGKLSEKLVKLKAGNAIVITKEEKDKIYQERQKCVKEWKKRKRMANDILNAILEGYPKTKKHLYEEIGVETDEDCGVTIPNV
ncbi:homologous-pairing protein 2 homolog [Octopus sinensis]|uniref:Homologous-pairing protein 2 homolog n=1 Tax=Octopus sinensis TaxID=2607531 RepID=A0A6P7SVF1_9MOLL|nr:homologous-pairing protein 2 homolog [Octopus sinensis]